MHRALLRLSVETPHPSILYRALKPEEGVLPGRRSRASLGMEGGYLTIEIEAEDTTALRAAANSFIRWCAAIARCIEEGGERELA